MSVHVLRKSFFLSGKIFKADIYRNISQIVELESIFVLEDYRNKSIGTKLYDSFIEWCKKKGVKRISVYVSFENKKAVNFYKSNKFKDYDLVLEREL